jgi:hypothetical protein
MDRWAAASSRGGGGGLFTVYRAADPTKPGANAFPVGRFTDPKVPPSGKKRVLITCAVHARELIVPEVCLHLLRLLAGTPADRAPVLAWAETNQALQKAGLLSARRAPVPAGGIGAAAAPADPFASLAPDFAKKYDLHVAPLINLSGRRIIERQGRYSQRKTGDDPQTDINRNFYTGWSGANKDLGSETYPGAAPGSQWEVRERARGREGGPGVVGWRGGGGGRRRRGARARQSATGQNQNQKIPRSGSHTNHAKPHNHPAQNVQRRPAP